ncbi:MAG: D-aminoacylase [Alphaproteobacteria bacterium]|nr:D-aminoacylase [Alphaproteobacteria bacterium]
MSHADVMIAGGQVIDGSGAPARKADVAVRGDRIAAVGDLRTWTAERRVNAAGRTVTPGFIDVHTHDDAALFDRPDMTMKISQGVTTVICGNCGLSAAPCPLHGGVDFFKLLTPKPESLPRSVDELLDRVDFAKPALNAAFLVGHSSLRMRVMGKDLGRVATPSEIDQMRDHLDDGLDAGAIGLSSGLFYPPAQAATTEELVEIATVLEPAQGVYAAHMRDEGDRIIAAIDETLAIGRAGARMTVISHHKLGGKRNAGRSRETLAHIERAAATQPLAFDVYPYVASSTMLMKGRLAEAERVLVAWSEPHPELAGQDLAAIAKSWGVGLEAAVDRLSPAGGIYFMMDEGDVRRIMTHKLAMIGSDGLPVDRHPHPRLWGTFARVLGHYSRDQNLFDLPTAVRKMTGHPAEVFGLSGRGRIAPGAYADLVMLDPSQVIDRADFERPTQASDGIEMVMVNGQIVWRDGAATGARPGRVLRRQALLDEAQTG